MYPYLFEIGPFTVASFGLMVATGFMVALYVLGHELQRSEISEPSEVAGMVINTALIGGLIGSKGYFLFVEAYEPLFSDQWFDLLSFENLGYGLTWYGGFVVATASVLWRLKSKRLPVLVVADGAVIALAVGYAIGRIGCQLAGDGDYGRIKSTAGIATLLADGLGDTLRVSLTEAPEKEIPVCYSILQSLGLRKTMVEYVACPSCGRTLFNLEEVLHKVRDATSHLTGLDIAVMGCIVNGPGEMADADYGYVGKTPGVISLYRGRDEIRKVPEEEGVNALIQLIKEDGRWVEPA